jgi:hypothetical protein
MRVLSFIEDPEVTRPPRLSPAERDHGGQAQAQASQNNQKTICCEAFFLDIQAYSLLIFTPKKGLLINLL